MSRTHHHREIDKEKKFGRAYHWYSNEPKWWRKLMKHKKRRQELRQALHKQQEGREDVVYPLDKKPWEWYW